MKLVINGEAVDIPSGGESSIPPGGIIIWSGAADAIPEGWALCNGENNTPDLRDRFVLGAGTSHVVGTTGGSEEVTLTVAQMPSHSHKYYIKMTGNTNSNYTARITTVNDSTLSEPSTTDTGGSQPHPNMPPYYTLCYIMKL